MLFMINFIQNMIDQQKSLALLQLLIFCLLIINSTSSSKQPPTTFGLTTVTHARAGSIKQFLLYLKRYAELQCPIITEINIVWNNQKSMEELGIFKTKHLWKRPIYFYKTTNNAMDWRYKLSNQSKAEVYFSIDDDILAGCDQLTKSFNIWRKSAVGNIGPLASYGPRYFTYDKQVGIKYGDPAPRGEFYSHSLIGLCFISRQFLDLYYADVFQITSMRQLVKKFNNCDDIALNFIVSYYYPQLIPIALSGNLQNLSPRIAQSLTTTHYSYRNKCIQEFSNIMGVNPQRYLPLKDDWPGKQKRLSVLRDIIVLQKAEYIQKVLIQKQPQPQTQSINKDYLSPSPSDLHKLEVKIAQFQKALMSANNLIKQKTLEIAALQKQSKDLQKQLQDTNSSRKMEQTQRSASDNIRLIIEFLMAIVILLLFNYILRLKIKFRNNKEVFQYAQVQNNDSQERKNNHIQNILAGAHIKTKSKDTVSEIVF